MTKEEIDKMNTINRDITEDEKLAIKSDVSAFKDIIRRIRTGKTMLEDYPDEMQAILKPLIASRK